MAEGAPLLRAYTGDRIEGSNPFVSATISFFEVAFNSFELINPMI